MFEKDFSYEDISDGEDINEGADLLDDEHIHEVESTDENDDEEDLALPATLNWKTTHALLPTKT